MISVRLTTGERRRKGQDYSPLWPGLYRVERCRSPAHQGEETMSGTTRNLIIVAVIAVVVIGGYFWLSGTKWW